MGNEYCGYWWCDVCSSVWQRVSLFHAGDNYTYFYDRTSTGPGDAVSGGPTKISLPASVGPAATVGLTWRPAPRWNFTASYSGSKVNARLTADTAGEIRTSHIEFNPTALIISVGLSF